MIGIPIGLFAVNATEWAMHKYVLHDIGRNKQSYWHQHWIHHRDTRRNDFYDPMYETFPIGFHQQGTETFPLIASSIVMAPLFPIAPFFTMTMWYGAFNYWRIHRKSHLHPDWARENLSWHYDHHVGTNQDTNWCVTRPWFDYVMGTRKPTGQSTIETNRLGMKLPKPVEALVNAVLGEPAKPAPQRKAKKRPGYEGAAKKRAATVAAAPRAAAAV